MMSLPERSRVLVSGFSAAGAAGSGICLTQTTTFMADHLCGPGPGPPFGPVTGLFAPGRRPSNGDGIGSRPPRFGPGAGPCDGQGVAERSVITASTPSSTMAAQVVAGVDRPDVDGQARCVGPRRPARG